VSPILSRSRLERMACDFFHTNKHKSFIGTRHFLDRVIHALEEEKQDVFEVGEDLLTLLASCFNLGVEGNSSALRRCIAFPEWCSESSNDLWFGAKSSPLQLACRGLNSYFNLLPSSDDFNTKILAQTRLSLDSIEPTRVLIVGSADLLRHVECDRRFFHVAGVEAAGRAKFSIVLAINKTSMMMDPISWYGFKAKLQDWADIVGSRVVIPISQTHCSWKGAYRLIKVDSHRTEVSPKLKFIRSWKPLHNLDGNLQTFTPLYPRKLLTSAIRSTSSILRC